MGKKTTTQTQANTYDYKTAPETADITALRGMKATADTSIPFNYAKMRENQANSFNNPLGAYTTPAVRDASARVTNQALNQDQAQAEATDRMNVDNINYGRQAALAGMTAPTLVQTGGTNTTTQQGGFWSGLLSQAIGAGSQVGSAALT